MADFFDWIKEKFNELVPREEDMVGEVRPIRTAHDHDSPKAENQDSGKSDRKSAAAADVFTNSLRMQFSLIDPGQFFMGSQIMESEIPPHQVTISKAFYLSRFTVTQQQFLELMGFNPSYSQGQKLPQLSLLAASEKDESFFNQQPPPDQPDFIGDLPVENLSWQEAADFCKKLSGREGRNYRLPTEAEWEYACRAGTSSEFYWGDIMDESFCNYAATFAIRGGRRGQNPWGLCDMLGNVFEWCSDWFGPYHSGPVADPTGPSVGTDKVYRGGSYDIDIDTNCRCASRFSDPPDMRRPDVGFRVVLER